ncbi:hypothetical protein ACJROX_27220 [Pseudalkalibacillus sp. A8]|uniref:hypothetical protein n=1 Tax=Pseudalkalibacillus sp. A8 TaxID=3382641 RepID=UPI0038B5A5CF
MAEDLCKDVLLYTQKYATHTIETQSDYEKFVENWLKKATYEEYKQMKNSGWNADTDFEWVGTGYFGADVDGGSTMSEEEFKKLQGMINQGRKIKIKEGKRYKEVHETINRYAISAWQTCIIQKYNGGPVPPEETPVVVTDDENKIGLCKKITPIGNDKIKILIWYNTPHPESEDPRPKINQISVIGGKVIEEDSFKKGEVIAGTKLMIVEREPREALSISILTGRGDITYDLPAFDLQLLNLKRFVFQLDLNTVEPNKVYTFRLPSEYKSIAAFPPGNFSPYGLWPNSLQEWQFSTQSIVMTSNQKLDVIVTAIYDPNNIWDVTIAHKSVDDETLCEAQLPDGYLITSGAYQIKVHWRDGDLRPNTSHICESEDLVSFYPKDNRTFQASIIGWCSSENEDGRNPPFSLTTYAIGIRSKSDKNIQHKIELKKTNTNIKLQDSAYISTGWIGFKMEAPPRTPEYFSFKFNLEKDEYSLDERILDPGDAIKYIIGIKHPNIPIEFFETSTQQINYL